MPVHITLVAKIPPLRKDINKLGIIKRYGFIDLAISKVGIINIPDILVKAQIQRDGKQAEKDEGYPKAYLFKVCPLVKLVSRRGNIFKPLHLGYFRFSNYVSHDIVLFNVNNEL